MSRGRGRLAAVAGTRTDRVATALYGALYCLGAVYVVAPIDPAVVLDELHLGCDARRGIRELERLLAGAR